MAKQLPKEIIEALGRLEPQLAKAIMDAFQNMADAAAIRRAEAEILAGNIDGAIEALRISPEWFTRASEALRQAYLEGGGIALAGLRLKDPYHGDKFVLGFDGRHIRAERWVSDKSSGLITEIIEDQRAMARQQIRAGLEAGRNPRQTALDLVGRLNRATGKREGGFIGLTSQQAQWARNAEAQLRGLDASYFSRTKRDKRYDATVRKAIAEGKPLSEADIQKIVGRYKDRLLKWRADLIAENETLTAMRAGAWEGIQQLVDTGKVTEDRIRRTWSATMDSRTRDPHRAMNTQKVRGLTPFTFPDGSHARFPGDVSLGASAEMTIRCRCWVHFRILTSLSED